MSNLLLILGRLAADLNALDIHAVEAGKTSGKHVMLLQGGRYQSSATMNGGSLSRRHAHLDVDLGSLKPLVGTDEPPKDDEDHGAALRESIS